MRKTVRRHFAHKSEAKVSSVRLSHTASLLVNAKKK